MAIPVDTSSGFRPGVAEPLFSAENFLIQRRFAAYDVGPDGRFAVVQRADDSGPPSIRVVLNWLGEIQQR